MEDIIIITVIFLIWWLIGIVPLVYEILTYADFKLSDVSYVLGLGLGGLIILLVVLSDTIKIKWKIKDMVLIKKLKS